MATWYNAQLLGSEGRYCIQFETSDYQQFKLVEHACQQAVDIQNLILAAKKDGATDNNVGHTISVNDLYDEDGGDLNG